MWDATFLEEYKDLDLVKIATFSNITTSQENVRFKGDRTSEKVIMNEKIVYIVLHRNLNFYTFRFTQQ